MRYGSLSYWTPGWTYPRDRLREPFPRRPRFACPEPGLWQRVFVAGTFTLTDPGTAFDLTDDGTAFTLTDPGTEFAL